MARPAGHRLNRAAFHDICKLKGFSVVLVSERTGVPDATLRGLVGGFHGASIPMAHQIAVGLDVDPQTLFPTLGRFAYVEPESAAV